MAVFRYAVLVSFLAVAIAYSLGASLSPVSDEDIVQRPRRHTGNCPDANYVEKHYLSAAKLGQSAPSSESSEEDVQDKTSSSGSDTHLCADTAKNFVEKHHLPANKFDPSTPAPELGYAPNQDYSSASLQERLLVVDRILSRVPLIDGHNDFPHVSRNLEQNHLRYFNFTDLRYDETWMNETDSHTDLVRLREGKVGAQFWVAYVPCSSQFRDAVAKTYEQIDLIHRLTEAYPQDLKLVRSVQELNEAFANGYIASLIGVEGGHSIGNSLANLRMMYKLGVRYMTLTHSCPTPWADNSELDREDERPEHGGLTNFGDMVVLEMNRLGMMVDISHVSQNTMRQVLKLSVSPVIFSHSSASALCNHTRNVPDDVLKSLADNGGVIMVNFYNKFLTCSEEASMQDVIDHMNHIRKVAGVKVIGIGADYNGIHLVPKGLEDVSKYPQLFAELLGQGWTPEELEQVAGKNLLRAFLEVERVRDILVENPPNDRWIPLDDYKSEVGCITYP